MDDNIFNDSIFENQGLNDYSSFRNITKNDLISSHNNFSKYLNSYKYKQIQPAKSPFIKRRDDFLNTNSFYRNYKDNTSFNRNNETFYGTNNLIEEFKDTLEKSQIIKDDILKSYRNDKIKNKYYKTNTYLNKGPTSYKRNKKLHKNKSLKNKRLNKYYFDDILSSLDDDDIFEDEKSNYSNGGDMSIIPNGQNFNNINGGINNTFNNKKINSFGKINELYKNDYSSLDYNTKDNKKLELNKENIINAYLKIKKENRILEAEINNYKKLANNYLYFGKNYNLGQNKYSHNTINNLKQNFQQTIQNNCKIIDLILNTQKQNELMLNKIKILNQKNNVIFQKIEKKNRKNAEIQILNEENEQKMLNLEEEKNNLIEELEKNKILLSNLKNKEQNLNLLNESNKKVLLDNEEHINKLKNTINQFNKYKNNPKKNNEIQFNNNINLYDQKINNLKSEMNNLISNKKKLLFYNGNLKTNIFNQNQKNVLNNNEKQLSQELNLLKKEINKKNNYLKQKDNQIEILKKANDSLFSAINSNNPPDAIQKMNINNLIKDIEMSDNTYFMEEENNIDNQIKQISEQNFQKNNEIEENLKKYKNIVLLIKKIKK